MYLFIIRRFENSSHLIFYKITLIFNHSVKIFISHPVKIKQGGIMADIKIIWLLKNTVTRI